MFHDCILRMEPASAEKLLKAFHILDPDRKGTLSKEYISKLMSEEGEPFTQASSSTLMFLKFHCFELFCFLKGFNSLLNSIQIISQDEVEEMMAAAVDVQSGDIHYEYYINSLMVNISFILTNFTHFSRIELSEREKLTHASLMTHIP